MLHPDLYHSNIRFSDISETLDDYYTALYQELNNPKRPPELYTKNKDTSSLPYEASAPPLQAQCRSH